MNLLAKIITWVILVVSIVLMSISMTVYSTHKNWKAVASGLQTKLNEARNLNEQLQSKKDSLESQLEAEVEAAIQEVRKLETARDLLLSQRDSTQLALDQLKQKERSNTAALASTQATNEKLTEEVEKLREDIRINQQARDEAFVAALKATDELHQAQGKLTLLTERNIQLAQEVGEQTSLLRSKGIDPNTSPDEVVPTVRGVVSAMHRTAGAQLIEVTIGADDGLKPGHTIEIFRGPNYLGRAEIMKTEPDRAVGRVLRKFQQGQIQENDNVATKLRVG
ncbi:MAG: hypothetical protein CMJ72_10885 [Planctomycetaceae bacterium]|nr:hypothetical protein [Planctomycetaceae bacterium]MBD15655.1 hypothetical protein [Planctomycetaceae bacterium]MCH2596721.1 hypothetical protein [Pirellulales bacterium]